MTFPVWVLFLNLCVVVVDDYNNPSPTYYPSTLHPQSLEKETPDNNSSLQLHLVEICPVTH